MNKSTRPVLITLSVFALLNVMFVPIFDVWGGLFPSDVDDNFFDVIKMVFKEGGDAWRHWVVLFTITIFVPSLMMFVASLTGSKGFFVTVNIIGILMWIMQIIHYGTNRSDGFDDLFDFEDGCVSIGVWIAIGIYVISLIIALSGRKNIPNTPYQPQPQYYQTYQPKPQYIQQQPQTHQSKPQDFQPQLQTNQPPLETSQPPISEQDKINFCPNCGSKTEDGPFCTTCGTKLF